MPMSAIQSRVRNLITKLFSAKYALATNTITGGILFIIGDAIEQKLEIRHGLHQKFDQERLKRIGLIGLAEGPPHYYFYKYLDVFLPGKSAGTITKKILLDQLIACPFFNFEFFVGMAWLEGKPLPLCWDEFVRKFPTVYLVDWLLWPPCQIINFWLVLPKYRVFYINVATVLWNVFLSYMKHYDQYPANNSIPPCLGEGNEMISSRKSTN